MGSMVRILHPFRGLIYTLSETASHESLTGLLVSGWKDTLDWFCVSLQQMYVKVLVIDVPSSL